MQSVMKHSFANIERPDIPRSTFDLSHGHKTTFDADFLIPCLCMDVIPGDTLNVNMTHFIRLATPLHPIMDNMTISTTFFFVPYRILWTNWEKFMGAQDDPGDSIDFTIPVMSSGVTTNTTTGKLWDYFGLPIGVIPNDQVASALPFRAYVKIFNAWYRDENLTDSITEDVDDGPDAITTTLHSTPLKRAKKRDYLTSCLPWPQKGDAVDLPLGSTAPIYTTGVTNDRVWVDESQGHADQIDMQVGAGSVIEIGPNTLTAGSPNLFADLTGATSATINDFRLAIQTQALLERDARAGTRYVETLLAHWGVTVPDFRLQRPEFLGGNNTPINVTPVANTSATATEDQGHLTGFGISSGRSGFTKSFVEHGVVIGLLNASADLTYSQGYERYWSKQTRYDFYYPLLSQIGEQSVLNKEIWADGSANDELVFGYQERYSEYRFKQSLVTGLMRPDAASTLASWNLSEDFATLPTLGNTWIQSNLTTPLDRAIADSTEPHFIADMYFNIKAARPMPLHGTPVGLTRF